MKNSLSVRLLISFCALVLVGLGFLFFSTKTVLASHFFGSSPAIVRVVVQDPGGTRIGNASINLWIAPVTSPRFCGYAGQNGNFGATHQGSGVYYFMNGASELQICCNAGGVAGVSLTNTSPNYYESNAMKLSVSAPGFQSISNANLDSFSPGILATNGSTTTYTVTLTPSTGSIQGIKVLMPGFSTPNPPGAQPVLLDGGSSNTNNPFGTGFGWGAVSAGNHTVSTSAPAGYTVIGSTVCTNAITCHTEPLSSNPAFAAGSSRVVNVPAGGGTDWRWYFVRNPTCSPASQSVTTGTNASLTASFGYNGYSWSAPGGTPSSGSGSSFNVSYATTGAKTVTVTSWGMSANCTVNVSSAPQVEYRIFNDLDNDGFLDAGEAFTSGFPFSASVASLNRNGSSGVVSTTGATSNLGVYGPVQVTAGSNNNQFQVIAQAGWQLTFYSSNRDLTGVTNCTANTTCSYNSGWTRSWTAVAGQTWTAILGVRQIQPDLVIRNAADGTSPAITGPTSVTCQQNNTYTARTRNLGPGPAAASTTRATTTSSTNNSDDFAVGALAPNTVTSLPAHSFTTSWSSAGTYTVSFLADVLNNNPSEVSESNTVSITVTVSCLPDLLIRNTANGTSPAIDGPTSVTCGVNNTYQAVTRNLGPGPAVASTSRASTTSSTNNSDDIAIGALAANASSAAYSFVTSWGSAGTYTVTFTADVFSTVAEVNEGNNTASISVTVTCPPDLVIRNAADGTSPAITGPTSVTCQQNNTYTARTRNLGPGPAAASTTRATTTSSTNNSDDFAVGALAPNTVTSLPAHSFTTSWSSAGTYTVTFTADYNLVVAESNNANNTASITVTVICLPNLRITSIAPIPPTGNVVNEPMSVQAWVDNNGSASASSFNNRLRARPGNNSFTAADTVNPDFVLPSLGNGSSSPVTWSLTPSVSGLYYFEVCADSNLVITELDETDNCSQTSTTILASRPWLRTVEGNVGSAADQGVGTDSISVWAPNGCPSTPTSCNSDYMIVATRSVKSTFKSAKTWLLTNYTPNLGTYNRYQRFKDDFSAGACPLSGNQFPSTQGRFTYSAGDMIYTSGTTPTACTQFSSLKNAAIIFYEQNLDIQTDLILVRPTVFIVKGNVSIRANVGRVDGMFVVDGNFTTESSNQQLRINGSVAAALNTSGLLTFGRDLGDDDNDDTPAELITFDPKYLYILTDFLGNPDSTYEETTP